MNVELTIEVPEGFDDVVFDKATNKVMFIKKETKFKSWSDYCNNTNRNNKWFSLNGIPFNIATAPESYKIDENIGKTYSDSKEECEAFIALQQLRLLRNSWTKNYRPECINGFEEIISQEIIYESSFNTFAVRATCDTTGLLLFSSKDMAMDFIKTFKDLLEKAKIFL